MTERFRAAGVAAWEAAGVAGPSGTVTFLFTDIEGSTRLWQQGEEAMRAAVARHDELLRSVDRRARRDGVLDDG